MSRPDGRRTMCMSNVGNHDTSVEERSSYQAGLTRWSTMCVYMGACFMCGTFGTGRPHRDVRLCATTRAIEACRPVSSLISGCTRDAERFRTRHASFAALFTTLAQPVPGRFRVVPPVSLLCQVRQNNPPLPSPLCAPPARVFLPLFPYNLRASNAHHSRPAGRQAGRHNHVEADAAVSVPPPSSPSRRSPERSRPDDSSPRPGTNNRRGRRRRRINNRSKGQRQQNFRA